MLVGTGTSAVGEIRLLDRLRHAEETQEGKEDGEE